MNSPSLARLVRFHRLAHLSRQLILVGVGRLVAAAIHIDDRPTVRQPPPTPQELSTEADGLLQHPADGRVTSALAAITSECLEFRSLEFA